MQARVKWIENGMFLGESGTGHTVVMEGSPDEGGREFGIRPMEMLLLGMGGCSSIDVISILKKARQQVSDCYVEISAERVDAVPATFKKIHLHFVITGKNLKESHIERAVNLSAEKYCSASIMLGRAGVEISHDYKICEQE
ncbi:OsmC family protein [Zooshikella harenae]|uniref:OsmC family protein n=1 Tax=Zooshikella harenae TaxID=2827238 RepID=A0ABS5Z8Z7_9GAMM|nr:OsmC family protein [Zooshikella harenae]MBU2710525.1 OsmC family protein [Zooshikella harenae]